ncbi:hypothetical protein FRC15_008666, partial [Serendipita sp. 397]
MGHPGFGNSFTDLASQFQATQFTTVAVITLWAYDHFLTLVDEIELVWKNKRFSWTKVLFFINRYLPILQCFFIGKQLLPTRRIRMESLLEYIVVLTLSGVLQVIITITIFTMRVYALSHGHPYFRRFLVISIVVSHTALIVFAALNITVPAETLIFGTTMRHAIRFHRGISSFDNSRSFSISKTLYSHGIQYYALILCLRIIAIVGFYTTPLGMELLIPTFVFYVASTMTSRFILSLQREVVNRRTPEETLMKSFPAVAIMNRGAPQAKQSPIELHNLGQLTNIGPSIFVVIDEIEELSTTEQSSS